MYAFTPSAKRAAKRRATPRLHWKSVAMSDVEALRDRIDATWMAFQSDQSRQQTRRTMDELMAILGEANALEDQANLNYLPDVAAAASWEGTRALSRWEEANEMFGMHEFDADLFASAW